MKGSFLSSIVRQLLLSITAALLILPAVASGTKGYTDPSGVNKRIEQLKQSSGGLVKVHRIAVSPGGRDVLLMEIGSGEGKPAVLVTGNFSGTAPMATEAALSLAEMIAKDTARYAKVNWFIVALGNPDAYARFFLKPLYLDPANGAPYNDDNDDQADEDGFNDLDGNGVITQMRVKSPEGTWVPVESDKRLMRKADPLKGEKGIYKLYTEGIDDDGDGMYNEDPAGGTNVNINFPHLFRNFGKRSGLYAGSSPEAYGLMKFAFDHPEIAMVMAFGSTNFLLAPPRGGRKGSVDMEKISIPKDIGEALGFDTNRTYSMAEIMEAVRPMVPPGMELDENMVAGFLGLGAVLNPMDDDLAFYNKISEQYKEYLKAKNFKDERFDPASDEDGSLELWSYYHLGLPVFSMDLWAVPKPKEEKKEEGQTLTLEALEKMSADEFVALGEDKINAFLKERGAPAEYNAKMIIEMVTGGKVTPPQIAAMMKQMPAPAKDEQKGDPKEVALLDFSDKWLDKKGFVEWKTFNHPTLGTVEIGGFVPFTDNTPPASMIDSLTEIQVPFVFDLVKKLPRLAISETKVTSKGGGVFQVEAWVTNEGFLPFPTAMGKKNEIPFPAIISIEGNSIEILSGKKRTVINQLTGLQTAKYTWLVRSAKKGAIVLKLESKQAGSDSRNLNIEG